jgi:hypothetical protein
MINDLDWKQRIVHGSKLTQRKQYHSGFTPLWSLGQNIPSLLSHRFASCNCKIIRRKHIRSYLPWSHDTTEIPWSMLSFQRSWTANEETHIMCKAVFSSEIFEGNILVTLSLLFGKIYLNMN